MEKEQVGQIVAAVLEFFRSKEAQSEDLERSRAQREAWDRDARTIAGALAASMSLRQEDAARAGRTLATLAATVADELALFRVALPQRLALRAAELVDAPAPKEPN